MSSPEESVFEMDAEPTLSSPQVIPVHHQTTCRILEGILGRCTQMEMEIHERAMEHVREVGEERKRSSLKRRLMVRLRKDGYDASLCRSSWVATTEALSIPELLSFVLRETAEAEPWTGAADMARLDAGRCLFGLQEHGTGDVAALGAVFMEFGCGGTDVDVRCAIFKYYDM